MNLEKPICPLMSTAKTTINCFESNCAIYNFSSGDCAFLTISNALQHIEEKQ